MKYLFLFSVDSPFLLLSEQHIFLAEKQQQQYHIEKIFYAFITFILQ